MYLFRIIYMYTYKDNFLKVPRRALIQFVYIKPNVFRMYLYYIYATRLDATPRWLNFDFSQKYSWNFYCAATLA